MSTKTSNSYDENSKSNINFNEEPSIDIGGFSLISHGSSYLGSFDIGTDCEYFKLTCGVETNDTTLTTDSFAAVCVDYEVAYRDEDGNTKLLVDSFYPKYKHENGGQADSTIINAPGTIQSIQVNVTNNEDEDVTFDGVKCNIAERVYVTPDSVGMALSSYYKKGYQTMLVIPLVPELPDVGSVPDGFICRLASIS